MADVIPKEHEDLTITAFKIENPLAKVKAQDKNDGKGKHFKIHFGYENPDLFPEQHEWTILVTGLVSVTFMIYWFYRVKHGNEEINREMRFSLKDGAIELNDAIEW